MAVKGLEWDTGVMVDPEGLCVDTGEEGSIGEMVSLKDRDK
jgi:hypothetical protein